MIRRFLLLAALGWSTTHAVRAAAAASPATGSATTQTPVLVTEVRAAIAADDFARGEKLVADARAARGPAPDVLLALSWLGRGALAANRLDRAEAHARETYDLCREAMRRRPLDQEPLLPTAFGAAIEVLGQVAAARGARSEAVAMLERELQAHRSTSIARRIQKNIHLLSLAGTKAPALDLAEFQGVKPPTLDELQGRVVLLFFWAHWCADCKAQAPILQRLSERYRARGLAVVAPTQRFGYTTDRSVAVPAEEENRHIERVRETSYPWLADVPVPLAEGNHLRYGVSSTPTLVLVDRAGVVRLYRPGRLGEEELAAAIESLL